MEYDDQAIARAKLWLKRFRDEFNQQLAQLDDEDSAFIENFHILDDRAETRAIISGWAADLDEIIKELGGKNSTAPAGIIELADRE